MEKFLSLFGLLTGSLRWTAGGDLEKMFPGGLSALLRGASVRTTPSGDPSISVSVAGKEVLRLKLSGEIFFPNLAPELISVINRFLPAGLELEQRFNRILLHERIGSSSASCCPTAPFSLHVDESGLFWTGSLAPHLDLVQDLERIEIYVQKWQRLIWEDRAHFASLYRDNPASAPPRMLSELQKSSISRRHRFLCELSEFNLEAALSEGTVDAAYPAEFFKFTWIEGVFYFSEFALKRQITRELNFLLWDAAGRISRPEDFTSGLPNQSCSTCRDYVGSAFCHDDGTVSFFNCGISPEKWDWDSRSCPDWEANPYFLIRLEERKAGLEARFRGYDQQMERLEQLRQSQDMQLLFLQTLRIWLQDRLLFGECGVVKSQDSSELVPSG